MHQTVMIYNTWLTHSAGSLEDNSPNLLEGTFIQDSTQIPLFLYFHPLLIHSVLWLNCLALLTWQRWIGGVWAHNYGWEKWQVWLMRGEVSTLWEQRHSKLEALEEGGSHHIWFQRSLRNWVHSSKCYYLLMEENYVVSPLVWNN